MVVKDILNKKYRIIDKDDNKFFITTIEKMMDEMVESDIDASNGRGDLYTIFRYGIKGYEDWNDIEFLDFYKKMSLNFEIEEMR